MLSQLYNTLRSPSVYQNTVPNKGVAATDKEIRTIKKRKTRLEWWRTYIYYFIALYYFPAAILQLILQKGFNYKPYELADLNMFIDFIFLGLVYIAITIHEKKAIIFEKPIIIALFLIIFIGQKIGSYRANEAQKIKDGKSDYKKDHISFNYNNNQIKTTDSILFIGETSNYIFLYNVKDSATKVYPFSKIDDLIIK